MPHAIKKVADAHLRNPKEIQVESAALTTHHIEQRGVAVPQRFKLDALARILAAEDRDATLIFARTRAGCQETADALSQRGLSVDALHGDLSQQARERVLSQLRTGRIDILVATDVAARGIDVERITHVINYDLPDDHEGYVHRIGRTGRAGRAGVAISLVTPRETYRIRSLENALKEKIERFDVPTDAEIDARRRARLVEQIRKASAEGNSPAIAAVLEALSVDSDLETVALGALRLLADRAGIELATIVSDQPPSWARSPAVKRGPSENRGPARAEGVRGPARAEGVELFIPVGKVRGIRAADVVGAIANDLGVESSQIGRITILPHKTFCQVSDDVATRILDGRGKLNLRGREVPVSKARANSSEGADRTGAPGKTLPKHTKHKGKPIGGKHRKTGKLRKHGHDAKPRGPMHKRKGPESN
jgi:ATP-dependent RNA helicase DeaD